MPDNLWATKGARMLLTARLCKFYVYRDLYKIFEAADLFVIDLSEFVIVQIFSWRHCAWRWFQKIAEILQFQPYFVLNL